MGDDSEEKVPLKKVAPRLAFQNKRFSSVQLGLRTLRHNLRTVIGHLEEKAPVIAQRQEARTDWASKMSAVPVTTFSYFAYGSNLLAQRILLQNPTAVRRGIGKLNNFRLDFNRFADRWGGCSATIVSDPGKHVWGAIWEIEKSQMESLDRQEGVNDHVYTPLQVEVVTPNEEVVVCRVYRLIEEPRPYHSAASLPEKRRPSRVYLETILQGAVESGLPEDYIQFLKSFPHNGFSGPVEVPGLNITFSLTTD